MRKRAGLIVFLTLLNVIFFGGCASTTKEKAIVTEDSAVLGGDGAVVISIRDRNIPGPDRDRRSYYKIYINKIEVGRTEIGLESQVKKYSTKLEFNSHLLEIEKYVLDEEKERYVKLNNIEQPKPNFFYFSNEGKRGLKLDVTHDIASHQTEYDVE